MEVFETQMATMQSNHTEVEHQGSRRKAMNPCCFLLVTKPESLSRPYKAYDHVNLYCVICVSENLNVE